MFLTLQLPKMPALYAREHEVNQMLFDHTNRRRWNLKIKTASTVLRLLNFSPADFSHVAISGSKNVNPKGRD